MTKPILVLLERHWDTIPKQALMKVLPFLITVGYDILGFETPSDRNQDETLADLDGTIQFIETRLEEANRCLTQHGQTLLSLTTIESIDYLALQNLLKNYVSTRYYKEMALWFKELVGYKAKRPLADLALKNNMEIRGLDSTSEQLNPINGFTSQIDLSKRTAGILSLDKTRATAFKNNMLNLHKQGKGVIFIMGQHHYHDLMEEFKKECPSTEIIFLHPHSPRSLSEAMVDYHLVPAKPHEYFTLIEKTIYDHECIDMWVTNLKTTVQQKLENDVLIEPTSTCLELTDKTKLPFEAYASPNLRVNCYHFFQNRDTVTGVANQLKARNITGYFTIFKNKPAYCVPDVNIGETPYNIQKIGYLHN